MERSVLFKVTTALARMTGVPAVVTVVAIVVLWGVAFMMLMPGG